MNTEAKEVKRLYLKIVEEYKFAHGSKTEWCIGSPAEVCPICKRMGVAFKYGRLEEPSLSVKYLHMQFQECSNRTHRIYSPVGLEGELFFLKAKSQTELCPDQL